MAPIGRLAMLVACMVCLGMSDGFAQGVLINELMYHPASEDTREEFVELLNAGAEAVNLSGWRFSTGVRYTFPETVLGPGEFLVVAADPAVFSVKYPGGTNCIGGWEGILSNSGQLLELVNAQGQRVDAVRYADEGDWAVRELAPVDHGHRGWRWNSEADGGGKSLELVNARLPNDHGQNWRPSSVQGGTPGGPNSAAAFNSAPLILEAAHFPIVPKSDDQVAITARILDESMEGLSVTVRYRVDGSTDFASAPMSDDGQHRDGVAGDGIFGATLPAQTNDTIVEFYLEATDAEGNTRTCPAPALADGIQTQTANLLYQVDDNTYSGTQPLFKLILKAVDSAELVQINRDTPAAPFETRDQTLSHAQFNGTFIGFEPTGSGVRYQVGIRNRGNGSRFKSPQSYRVNFSNDRLWKKLSAINLNTQYPHAQLFGSVLYRRSGLPTQSARPVQVRVNNLNHATSGPPSYGFYVCNEALNSEFVTHAFPHDSSGNLYRGIRLSGKGADLHFEGDEPAPYRLNYFKHTNNSEDDWTDLIELTRALSQSPDENYVESVRERVNIEEWMLYFALETLVDNKETNLANGDNGSGEGDDYFLYRGVTDPRFNLLPYDLDTILDEGDTHGVVTDGLFRMAAGPVVARFIKHPEFAPIYYSTLKRLIETTFAPAVFDPLVDQTLSGLVPDSVMADMKAFGKARGEFVLGQIPQRLIVSNDLPVVRGSFRTTNATVDLYGQANAIETRTVLVDGTPAVWTAWNGAWTIQGAPLDPGINRLLVQTLNAGNRETERRYVDVWRDTGSVVEVTGALDGQTIWSAATGPYLVRATLTVPAGAALVIEPGTTVFLAPNAGFDVTGRLQAEGSDQARIRFTLQPSAAGSWSGLNIHDGAVESRIAYADFEFGGAAGQTIEVRNSAVSLDHVTFTNTNTRIIDLNNSSFVIRSSVFPDITGAELIVGHGLPSTGYAIIQGNWFGSTTGLNDIIDFTGGQRPGAILQVIENVFTGASDDHLDLDGTDAHVEGNIFLHAHQSASLVDSSSSVSGGKDGANTSDVVIVRNLFYDCDHIALAKEGNYYTIVNNTAVGMTRAGVLFDEPGRRSQGVTPGRGALLDGNVVAETAFNFEDVYVDDPVFGTTELKVNRSMLSGSDYTTNGVDNMTNDPRLVSTAGVTAQTIRRDFSLRPGSPALGTGPNGLDRGALVPAGASLAGEPPPITHKTSATLTVGGPGIIHYKFQVNDGPYSEAIPVGTPIELVGLANGTCTVRAVGMNSAGVWQDVASAVSKSWAVDTNHSRLVINEVMASNKSAVQVGTTFPDLIELYNDSPRIVDLGGMGITTRPGDPYMFLFPPGITIGPDGYLVLYADRNVSEPGIHLGFALKQTGESVFLFESREQGGKPIDAIAFGQQLPDLSIGRVRGDRWALTSPTFGSANKAVRTGDPTMLRINEWLAGHLVLEQADFVELYNPDSLPVDIGSLTLTDNPVALPAKHAIAPLSFVAPKGFAVFIADGDTNRGPQHLSFALESEEGMIGLFSPRGEPIDEVIYGTQYPDMSEGRSPSGADRFAFFTQLSPGAGNPGFNANVSTYTVELPLLSITNTWKYDATGDDLGTVWRKADYNDSAWPEATALFYNEDDDLPAPKSTPIPLVNADKNRIITYYFRTRFELNTNKTGLKLLAKTVLDDGLVAYLNGEEVLRHNMPEGDITSATRASDAVGDADYEGPFELPTGALREGNNVLAVEVHQVSSSSTDVTFGMSLAAGLTVTNVSSDFMPALLNEVLASNSTLTNAAGVTPDWIELFNPADIPADLSDTSLSDDLADPRKWVFPADTVIPARSFLLVECDPTSPPSERNTGFGLASSGGGVYLFGRSSQSSPVLDSLLYGPQVPDFSLGRVADGGTAWMLNLPTPGTGNLAATTGDPARLRINEWMANPVQDSDWIELYNPNAQPVSLGGLFLTDDVGEWDKHPVHPHSFIGTGTNAFLLFVAGNNLPGGASPLELGLSALGDSIQLFSSQGKLLDSVAFGSQAPGVSEGRLPDGAAEPFVAFPSNPTPGRPNGQALAPHDNDQDGMPDEYELAHDLDPTNAADAAEDADGDGLTNLREYLAGTDPRSASSVLRIEGVHWDGNDLRLGFTAVAGHSYSVLYRDSLAEASWLKLTDVDAVSVMMVLEVRDPNAGERAARYYQLVTPAIR